MDYLSPRQTGHGGLKSSVALGLIVLGGIATIAWSAFLAWVLLRLLLTLW